MELSSRTSKETDYMYILVLRLMHLLAQEWVWPIGYFLRAYLYFDIRVGAGKRDINETLHHIHSRLLQHRHFIQNDAWAGLPEL